MQLMVTPDEDFTKYSDRWNGCWDKCERYQGKQIDKD